jgi:hypothetical protein
MFCPNCGSQHESPPRYCKSCGCNLVRVSVALSEDPLSSGIAAIEAKHLKRILRGALFSLIVVLAILWSLAFGVGQIKSDEFIPFASIVSWIAIMVFLSNWGIAHHLKKLDTLKLNQPGPDRVDESSIHGRANVLIDQGPKESSLSVTEQTTELLAQEVKPTKKM